MEGFGFRSVAKRHVVGRPDYARAGNRAWRFGACQLVVGLWLPLAFGAVTAAETPVVRTPVNTSAPELNVTGGGSARVGGTLSCSTGGWSGNPTGFTFTWLRNGSPIAGQTGSTYVIESTDVDASLSCEVTAANGIGEYRVSGLPSGSYTVKFSRAFEGQSREGPNVLPQWYNGEVAVMAGSITSQVNAAMREGGQISGRVTSEASGEPLKGVLVSATDSRTNEYGSATTNANGEYTVSGLSGGSYKIVFNAEEQNFVSLSKEAVEVTAGSTTSSVDAALKTGGQITGTVASQASHEPVAHVSVFAYAEGLGGGVSTVTNEHGEYTVSGLETGHYYVRFVPSSEAGNYLPEDVEKVPVTARQVTSEVDVALKAGGQIKGRVINEGGEPIAGITVQATSTGLIYPFIYPFLAKTDANGEYALVGLPSKAYEVDFYSGTEGPPLFYHAFEGPNYLPRWYPDKDRRVEDEPVEVTAGTTKSGIDATLRAGGKITGRVTSAASGQPLEGVHVSAGGAGINLLEYATTNANGEYTITALETNSYKLDFTLEQGVGNYQTEDVKNVPVTAGATRSGIDVALKPGGQITGKVTNAAGVGIGGVLVEVRSPDDVGSAETNSSGASASATSNSVSIPAANSNFRLTRPAIYNSRAGVLEFTFMVAEAGTFRWRLSFKNADVGFADSLNLSALAAKKSKKCRRGLVKRRGRCVRLKVPFASGSAKVAAGTVTLKIRPSAKATKALEHGHRLHVSGTFNFQSFAGGPPVTHVESTTVKPPRNKKKR